MGRIADNLKKIKLQLGNAELLVVSKFRSIQEIQEAYDAGQRKFAENRVQALLDRKDQLPADIEWHLIGHLQTNKVKYLIPFISMIQSVDSEKLMQEIQIRAAAVNRKVYVLLQIHISKDNSKFGLTYADASKLLESNLQDKYPNLVIRGLMGMATLTNQKSIIQKEFEDLYSYYLNVKSKLTSYYPSFEVLSMGMSSDFDIAISAGSNMVRIGSAVFE